MTPDPWTKLKSFSAARIALGRAGASVPTGVRLEFQLDQARARDAVRRPFDAGALAAELAGLGGETRVLSTAAADRATYLRRPDWGRRLAEPARAELERLRARGPWDLAVLVSDGLSSPATAQVRPVLAGLLPELASRGWRVAPVMVLANARVAVQDEAGGLLGAELSLMLLGERPGLGAADSLGAYLTFGPGPGRTDADRNCVSNIRPEGLPPAAAAGKLLYLLTEARRLRLSGVGLKDESGLPDSPVKRVTGGVV